MCQALLEPAQPALPLTATQLARGVESILKTESSWEHLTLKVIVRRLEKKFLPWHPRGVLNPHKNSIKAATVAAMMRMIAEEGQPRASPTRDIGHAVVLEEPHRTYKLLHAIGAGTYSTVYKARDDGGGEVAVKVIKRTEHGVCTTTISELAIMKVLGGGEHVTQVRDLIIVPDATDGGQPTVGIVQELMDLDLLSCLATYFPCGMPRRLLTQATRQLLRGIDWCHKRRVLHRDIKSANVLLAFDGRLKLGDFGLARAMADAESPTAGAASSTGAASSRDGAAPRYTGGVCTLWYRAPELLMGSHEYGSGVDLWSMGCVLSEMATGQNVLPGDCDVDQLFRIFRLLGTPDDYSWPGVTSLPYFPKVAPRWSKRGAGPTGPGSQPGGHADLGDDPCGDPCANLLYRLLAMVPSARPSAEQALAHPFLDVDPQPPEQPPLLRLDAYVHPAASPADDADDLVPHPWPLWQEGGPDAATAAARRAAARTIQHAARLRSVWRLARLRKAKLEANPKAAGHAPEVSPPQRPKPKAQAKAHTKARPPSKRALHTDDDEDPLGWRLPPLYKRLRTRPHGGEPAEPALEPTLPPAPIARSTLFTLARLPACYNLVPPDAGAPAPLGPPHAEDGEEQAGPKEPPFKRRHRPVELNRAMKLALDRVGPVWR